MAGAKVETALLRGVRVKADDIVSDDAQKAIIAAKEKRRAELAELLGQYEWMAQTIRDTAERKARTKG